MKIKIFLLAIISILSLKQAFSQEIKAQDTIEASFTDFTKIKEFNAKRVNVFGLRIGQSINDAKSAIDSFKAFNLRLEQDRYNNYRFYLYEILGNDSIKNPIGLCKWESANGGLNEVILYEDAIDCLAGDAFQLFSGEAIDSFSTGFAKTFLGEPSKVVVDLDVPSLGLKSTRYYFPKRALIVIENKKPEKISYHLAFYKSHL